MGPGRSWLRTHVNLLFWLVAAAVVIVLAIATWPGAIPVAFLLVVASPLFIVAYILRLVVLALRKYINS